MKKNTTAGIARNRAIKTDHNEEQVSDMITLEAQADIHYEGTPLVKGETVTVSKSEAKRLLTIRGSHFRIVSN